MKKSGSKPGSKKRVRRKAGAVSVRNPRRSTTSKSAPRIKHEGSEVDSAGAPATHTEQFRIDYKPRKLLLMGTGTLLFGVISIYFYINILLELHNYYTLIFVVPLYGYVFGDLILWVINGIRTVEVSSSGFKIVRSNSKAPTQISLSDIGSIRVTPSLDGKSVNILLHGARSKKFLWMDVFSGPRVRIPEGVFGKHDFAEFTRRATTVLPSHRLQ